VIAAEAGCVVNDFFANDGLRNGNYILAAVPTFASALQQAMGH
jgi:hypothetical protein